MTTPATPFPHPPAGLSEQLAGPLGPFLQHQVLPGWLPARRWFRSKSRRLTAVAFEALFPCDRVENVESARSGDDAAASAVLAIVRVDFADDDAPEFYLLPLATTTAAREAYPDAAVLGPVLTPAGERLLIDASWHEGFRMRLFDVLLHAENIAAQGDGGFIRGLPVSAPGAPHTVAARGDAPPGGTASRVLSAEQSNTALVYGDGKTATRAAPVFVKLYRRLEPGVHPEPEMLRFLSEHTSFRQAPAFLSALEWTDGAGRVFTAALAQEFFPGAEDAWGHVVASLRAHHGSTDGLRATAAVLGRCVGEFHRAAAPKVAPPDAWAGAEGVASAFAPEVFTAADAETVRDRARASLDAGLRQLETLTAGPGEDALRTDARALLACRSQLARRLDDLEQILSGAGAGLKIRTHGDLHLGQFLLRDATGPEADARLLDFEGEPGRPLAAARAKQSPLRDVAGMIRSFHYAAHAASRPESAVPDDAKASFDAESAATQLQTAFLEAYFATGGAHPGERSGHASATPASDDETALLMPETSAVRTALLDLFVLEKATYELQYECDNRPDWAAIPVKGLLSLCPAREDAKPQQAP